MFQAVQAFLQPSLAFGRVLTLQVLADLVHMLSGMGKIQDANRLGTMKINKALLPVGAIHDGGHLPRILHAPPMHFHQRQPSKRLGSHFSGK